MMKLIFLGLCLFMTTAQAEIIWVGDSTACDAQSKSEDSLSLALFYAIFNTDTSDEIRLTNANTTYTGNAGHYTITNWSGILTIKGGYSDCGVATSVLPILGSSADPVFTINNSTVLLTNLTLSQSGSRALLLDNYATAVLDNVMVDNNQSGIEVKANSYVNVKTNSAVQFNNDDSVAKGGGIYCHGANSGVLLSGKVDANSAVKGGNIFAETGCFVELDQKSAVTNGVASDAGGGLLIDNGGELWAEGGAELVTIQSNTAVNGGGIFVWGTGRVTLLNTYMDNNFATDKGSAIFAANSGSNNLQLTMDRVEDCPFLISCSIIQNSHFNQSVVYVYNSLAHINRTIATLNTYQGDYTSISGIFHATNNAIIKMNRVAVIRNDTLAVMSNGNQPNDDSALTVTHMTAARNHFQQPGHSQFDSWAVLNQGTLKIQSSIFTDTMGVDFISGSFVGKCNLIDDSHDWPGGTYSIGVPQFINVDGGDMRQVASSPGVDMCIRDDAIWSDEIDLEYQDAPVNENTNPQGNPGNPNGIYDAGVDEVYDNIGEDEFLLTVQRSGYGTGNLVSTPLGIACGSDCTEVYFNGTEVTLFAAPTSGNVFSHWIGCQDINGTECTNSITSSQTVTAVFQPNDLIFGNGFEDNSL